MSESEEYIQLSVITSSSSIDTNIAGYFVDHEGKLFVDRVLRVFSGNPIAFSSSELYNDILKSYVIPRDYEVKSFIQGTANRGYEFALFVNLMDFSYLISDKVKESGIDASIAIMNTLMNMNKNGGMGMRSFIAASGPALKALVYACEDKIQNGGAYQDCQYFDRDYLELAVRLNMHEKLPEYLSRFEDMVFDGEATQEELDYIVDNIMSGDNIQIRDAVVYWKTKYRDEIQSLFERKAAEDAGSSIGCASSMRI